MAWKSSPLGEGALCGCGGLLQLRSGCEHGNSVTNQIGCDEARLEMREGSATDEPSGLQREEMQAGRGGRGEKCRDQETGALRGLHSEFTLLFTGVY